MKNTLIETESNNNTLVIDEVSTIDNIAYDTRVILFNDEIHTFDEVAEQIMKAINCPVDRAMDLTNQVHSNGKAAIYNGDLSQCLKVSSVLQEINLHTQIEC